MLTIFIFRCEQCSDDIFMEIDFKICDRLKTNKHLIKFLKIHLHFYVQI